MRTLRHEFLRQRKYKRPLRARFWHAKRHSEAVCRFQEPRFSQVVPNAVTATRPSVELQPGLISTDSTARHLHRHLDADSDHDGGRSSAARRRTQTERKQPERPRLEMVPPGRQPSLFSPGDFASMPASLRLERADATHGYIVPRSANPLASGRSRTCSPSNRARLSSLRRLARLSGSLPTPWKQRSMRPSCGLTDARTLGFAWDSVVIFLLSMALSAILPVACACGTWIFPCAIRQSQRLCARSPSASVCLLHRVCQLRMGNHRLECRGPAAGAPWTDRIPLLPALAPLRAEFVGLIALCIGYIWILFEEESLGWHDQISETFPTPRIHSERASTNADCLVCRESGSGSLNRSVAFPRVALGRGTLPARPPKMTATLRPSIMVRGTFAVRLWCAVASPVRFVFVPRMPPVSGFLVLPFFADAVALGLWPRGAEAAFGPAGSARQVDYV